MRTFALIYMLIAIVGVEKDLDLCETPRDYIYIFQRIY